MEVIEIEKREQLLRLREELCEINELILYCRSNLESKNDSLANSSGMRIFSLNDRKREIESEIKKISA